ncbi:response regulator [Runella sp.]|jgi:CheY-like chemotaxis protein|uniref:response regulator n=1 Tax=Runella sp. TaxID=1960881 RepID=UPI0026108974|nr:response regulator [Runella sp.]
MSITELKNADKSVLILLADDDEDDRMFTKEAFEENHLLNEIRFVNDGVELMDYLKRREKYSNPADSPRPGMILLDLNMPKMDGREALKEIKSDPSLRSIPIVVLTTSKAEQDVLQTYDLGVNCFITKPVAFADFIEVTRTLGHYWFDIVQLPNITE